MSRFKNDIIDNISEIWTLKVIISDFHVILMSLKVSILCKMYSHIFEVHSPYYELWVWELKLNWAFKDMVMTFSNKYENKYSVILSVKVMRATVLHIINSSADRPCDISSFF